MRTAKIFKPPSVIPTEGESELNFWRRQLFERLAYIFFIATTVLVLPSAIGGFVYGVPFVGIFDIIMYLAIAFLYLNHGIELRYRHLIIELVFIIGLAMLLALGPLGAGFIWLFAYCLFSTILFGEKGSKRSFLLVLFFLSAFAVLVQLKVFESIKPQQYDMVSFTLTSINFLGLVYVINYSFAYIVNKLELTFKEQKQAAQQFENKSVALENANKELDNLVYSISHDIRSPLANIQGLSQLGLMDSDSTQLTDYFKRIEKSAIRLQEFTEQITNFFKIDKTAPNLNIVNLYEATNEILEGLVGPDKSSFEVFNQIDKDLELKTDATRLGLILGNLLSNAIKYQAPSRKLTLQISSETLKDSVELSILDNGIGIREELIQSIFDIFTRATTSSKGSGLGLYIVKQCVTHIQAQIDVTSKEGEYTCFKLSLPKELHVKDAS